MLSKRTLHYLGLFSLIIISMGLAWPINKIGLNYTSALWYTALRLIYATFAMFIVATLARRFSIPQKHDWPLILAIGLLQISLYILLTNIGLRYLPAGRSSLLAYTTPLWVMPLSILFFNERASISKWLGFLFGISGLILLIAPWQLNWQDKHIIIGIACLLLASFSWAISMFCARYMKWGKTPLELMPWQLLIGAIPILLLAIIKEPTMVIINSWQLWASLVYTGIIVTGFAYWFGVIINKELPTLVVSIGFLLVPVLSMIISAYFLHEVITSLSIAAMLLILLGLSLVLY
jgi:drug/metabolite transporter (DMT)-like permease